MSAEETGTDDRLHWCNQMRWYTALRRLFLLALAGSAFPFAVDPLWGRSSSGVCFSVGLLVFVYVLGRYQVVAFAFGEREILVRRLLPGRVERIKVTEVARCVFIRLISVGGVLGESIQLLCWSLFPATIQGTYRPSRDLGLPDDERQWAELVSEFRQTFQPTGKWIELDWSGGLSG